MGTIKKQKKFSISFKESSEVDQELYNWIVEKSKVIGFSNFCKETLYKVMEQEQQQGSK